MTDWIEKRRWTSLSKESEVFKMLLVYLYDPEDDPVEWHYRPRAGNNVVVFIIALVEKKNKKANQQTVIARVCISEEKQKQKPETRMIMSHHTPHPLPHPHIQICTPTCAHACTWIQLPWDWISKEESVLPLSSGLLSSSSYTDSACLSWRN